MLRLPIVRVLFGALWVGLACEASAAEPTGRLGAGDIFNIELAADPQVSPDGSKVAYVRQASDIMADKRYSNLWLVNLDGSDHRALTSGKNTVTNPRWSPDGKRLIYISDEGGTAQIRVRWMDNGQIATITNLEFAPSGIAWSPDGQQISFTTLVAEKPRTIAALPGAPQGAAWATPPTVIDRLQYRFDGAGYLKTGYIHLFVVPAEGGTPRQISHGDFQHGGPAARASEAVWSPDGKSLVMSANRRDDHELNTVDTEIYEFSLADGSVKALTDRRGPDGAPAISPDGKWIAYTGFDDAFQSYQVTRLYVMNRDGSGSRLLTKDLDRDAGPPHWAADSSGVYFLHAEQGNTKLALCKLDGSITTLAGDVSSLGGPGGFSVAKDGRFAFARTRPDLPADVAVGRAGEAEVRTITALNRDLLADKTLGQVEEIWYPSSHDSRKIHGWIIKPPGFDPAKKYPLILEIHGGPHSNYGDRFELDKQIWAAQGYVVLYTNPRGSTSYGGEFGNLIHHRYPGDDFYDLDSGVDAVIAKGYVDPDNLFVTGGSGGGVLTCWMIGRSNRFRAAVPAYPVINWYSFVLTADIGAFSERYWFPGLPWDHVDHYMQRSLLSVVRNVRTPTMIITGEEDYRTPISESEQYFAALKMLGVEAVLVRMPSESHGVRKRPSHQVARVLYTTGWFETHKKK